MKSILDPSFRYVSSSNTDLRKTFARIRRQQQAATERMPARDVRKPNVVAFEGARKTAA